MHRLITINNSKKNVGDFFIFYHLTNNKLIVALPQESLKYINYFISYTVG